MSFELRQHFSPVWYASQSRVLSRSKFLTFDDRGVLDITSNGFIFRGKNTVVKATQLVSVKEARQVVPWISFGWTFIACLAFVGVFSFAISSVTNFGIPHFGWWVFLYFAVLLIFSTIFGVITSRNLPWIEVKLTDENNEPHIAYLADASLNGWGGVFGGTRKLQYMLKEISA